MIETPYHECKKLILKKNKNGGGLKTRTQKSIIRCQTKGVIFKFNRIRVLPFFK